MMYTRRWPRAELGKSVHYCKDALLKS